MIRTNAEYRDAQERLRRDRAFIAAQQEKLGEMDLSPEEIQRAIEPVLSFHEQLQEEVETYERLVRGDTTVIESLAEIGGCSKDVLIFFRTHRSGIATLRWAA
jgi:hypothetical protein